MKTIIWFTLFLANLFLAITAIGGGIGLLTGFGAPPVEILRNSIFPNFIVPGLVLLIFVGGTSLTATIFLIRRHNLAKHTSLAAAIAIIIFEAIEVYVIGSPKGIARDLQILYFLIGIIIGSLSLEM